MSNISKFEYLAFFYLTILLITALFAGGGTIFDGIDFGLNIQQANPEDNLIGDLFFWFYIPILIISILISIPFSIIGSFLDVFIYFFVYALYFYWFYLIILFFINIIKVIRT